MTLGVSPDLDEGFYIYTANTPQEGIKHYLSILSPEVLTSCDGLPAEAIVGVLEDPRKLTFETFKRNKTFFDVFQQVIARTVPTLESAQAAVKSLPGRVLSVIDPRVSRLDQGAGRSDEHKVGEFELIEGRFDSSTYHPNLGYALLSRDGLLFGMEPTVKAALLAEIRRRVFVPNKI